MKGKENRMEDRREEKEGVGERVEEIGERLIQRKTGDK
jgi:hypothetical protein